ncbi:hypothetical protein LX36DRAFT_649134 [Colletotrichum falcatum]|nr:hypothetical protein LX36DRAFT_649134 [Colletotrichum falcatum]
MFCHLPEPIILAGYGTGRHAFLDIPGTLFKLATFSNASLLPNPRCEGNGSLTKKKQKKARPLGYLHTYEPVQSTYEKHQA